VVRKKIRIWYPLVAKEIIPGFPPAIFFSLKSYIFLSRIEKNFHHRSWRKTVQNPRGAHGKSPFGRAA
jgi:hypothetical protein